MNLHGSGRSLPGRRARRLTSLTVVALVVTLTAAACSAHTSTPAPSSTPLPGKPAPAGAYAPAADRNADFLGESSLTSSQIHDIATDDASFTIAKFADKFDIATQFSDAKTLMAAARAAGNPGLSIDMYYNASFWLLANDSEWKPYTDTFDTDWYLKDATGTPVAYHGQGKTQADDTIGYVLDLGDPAYRAWAVNTVVSWMKQAPVKGITLDSADLLVGTTTRSDVATGKQTWNDLLCGAGAAVDANGDCTAVAAWNQGLQDLLAQMSAALAPLGDKVTFNGVAPSQLRTSDRNQELFADAPMADNEGFCMGQAKTVDDSKIVMNSVPNDVAMMQTQAQAGHGIVEITNYKDPTREAMGPYCVGAFLMGWQPGYDYEVFHRDYSDPLSGSYPQVAEMNLDLGLPTAQETDVNGVMTRSFAHGTVVVNTSTSSATTTLPAAMTLFQNGRELQSYPAGATVDLPHQSADFFLSDAFLSHATST